MKNFYRVLNSNIDEIKFHYGDAVEVIETEHQYTLIRCADDVAEQLKEVEIFIVRA